MRYAWHLRWIVPAIVVGWVAWQGLFASGTRIATTNFWERTPYFDVLLPAGRVTRTPLGLALQQEPVYVDVRLPVRAQGVTLELDLTQSPAPQPGEVATLPKLGVQTSDGFTFAFGPEAPQQIGNVFRYRYQVSPLPFVRPGHQVRFIISAPALATHAITVLGAHVEISREPFSWGWLKQRLAYLL